MTQAYAWCMEEYRQVVFMDVRTIVMHDINGLVAGCEGGDGVGLCAVATGEDLPFYKVDPGVMVAFPSKDRCEDLARIASMPRFRTASCAKTLFNTYFTYEERMVVDPRFNTITFETKTVHKLKDAFVIQYAPSHVPSTARADFSILFRKVDRVVDLFSAELKNRMPWHVLYATLLTPPTQEGEAVITSSAALMKHFVSQFALGKIPWKNQAIIYTENAYPEVREWLVAKGGHAIKVPSLLCPNPRGARSKYGFTKLQLFGLKDWDVVVHIDPGTIILDDITRLWRACPSEFNLCLVEEPEHKPEAHYPNDGVLVTRPDTAFYRRIMNCRKRFSPSRTPCETDFFYRFLKPQGYGLLDPKYNMMAFDPYRRLGFVGAKIIRTDLLEKGGSREERSFLDAKLDEISELSLQYNISDSDSTTERKTGLWFFLP
ncbi:Inositol phosphorylceramide glucuronosyltransferase 1 [Hondaea fermentalgiana]|uniref:Inositol phosphorylceramide glucuronosyltransferase 1 n=1 Tax=Hondaea fermentalgiana TaxID=2315210 RepID=A0A2R5GUA4_9STRA|nr:Inositol phosphorylceramide glucuronosyltransferase 1 [Hondaea fermentalgiana]|eukprot:GBG31474.1 Inositol phosphorylceramide glucuronosyltransferase 1 [Hondaea fermentalgiana]